MSEELKRYCDMDDCKEGKYVFHYSCGHDICSLCEEHEKEADERVCPLCVLNAGRRIEK